METQQRKVRRAPNVVAFLVSGGLVGLLVGVAIALIGPDNPNYSGMTLLGLFGVVGAALGLLVGGIILVVLDKRSLR